MTRTPDEVKKALEFGKDNCLFVNGDCKDCAYEKECSTYDCDSMAELPRTMISDALALIRQLQDDNAEKDERIRVLESRNNALYHTILGVMHFVDKWIDDAPAYDPDEDLNGTAAIGRASQAREITLQVIEQLQAERDAAVRDMTKLIQNSGDSYCEYCINWKPGTCPPYCRTHSEGFRWRGAQKEK